MVEDPIELKPLALRSGLGAIASMHGKPLLRDTKKVLRTGVPTHILPDLSLLQSGTALAKAVGFTSAYMYSGTLHESTASVATMLSDDDDDSDEEEDPSLLASARRLRLGQPLFTYKGTPSEQVEEMISFVGYLEEYEPKKPLTETSPPHVRAPVAVGYKFKRTMVNKKATLCWLQGASRSLEHEESEVVLTAIHLTDTVYVVEGSTEELLGKDYLASLNRVLSSSSLFAAHREHGLLQSTNPVSTLTSLARGALAKKPTEKLETLLIALHAQMFYAVAHQFTRKFASMAKMAGSIIAETQRELLQALAEAAVLAHKQCLWLLAARMNKDDLKALLLKVNQQVPTLQKAATAALKLPKKAAGTIQDEMEGAGDLAKQAAAAGRTRKAAGGGGGKAASPTKEAKDAPTKRVKGLEELMSASLSQGRHTAELAEQMRRQQGKFVSLEDVEALREEKRAETLRADREQQRADAAEQRATSLDKELSSLRSKLDEQSLAARSAASASASASSSEASIEDHPVVKQLRSQISFLERQNSAMLLMVGGDRPSAASLLVSK